VRGTPTTGRQLTNKIRGRTCSKNIKGTNRLCA
jgi:hypothetical protein